MDVSQCMKKQVVSVPSTATVADAAALFSAHHIGTLPVVDEKRRLVGILLLRDLIHLSMPVFVDLIEDFDYVGDFGAMEDQEPDPEVLKQPIINVMEGPTAVRVRSGLVRAFAFIHKHDLLDLPVVNEDDQLVGLSSRVDIGRALLANWGGSASSSQSS